MKFRWLRRLVRRNTRPIPEDKAVDWKKRLSFLYAFFAWNSFGFVCYMVMTGRGDWAKYYGYKTEEEEMSSGTIKFKISEMLLCKNKLESVSFIISI